MEQSQCPQRGAPCTQLGLKTCLPHTSLLQQRGSDAGNDRTYRLATHGEGPQHRRQPCPTLLARHHRHSQQMPAASVSGECGRRPLATAGVGERGAYTGGKRARSCSCLGEGGAAGGAALLLPGVAAATPFMRAVRASRPGMPCCLGRRPLHDLGGGVTFPSQSQRKQAGQPPSRNRSRPAAGWPQGWRSFPPLWGAQLLVSPRAGHGRLAAVVADQPPSRGRCCRARCHHHVAATRPRTRPGPTPCACTAVTVGVLRQQLRRHRSVGSPASLRRPRAPLSH